MNLLFLKQPKAVIMAIDLIKKGLPNCQFNEAFILAYLPGKPLAII